MELRLHGRSNAVVDSDTLACARGTVIPWRARGAGPCLPGTVRRCLCRAQGWRSTPTQPGSESLPGFTRTTLTHTPCETAPAAKLDAHNQIYMDCMYRTIRIIQPPGVLLIFVCLFVLFTRPHVRCQLVPVAQMPTDSCGHGCSLICTRKISCFLCFPDSDDLFWGSNNPANIFLSCFLERRRPFFGRGAPGENLAFRL